VLDPAELYEFSEPRLALDRPVLVQALDGFVDAGGAVRLAREHLLAGPDTEIVATFDVDQLYDYRARRPDMIFASDHWQSYADPKLALYAARDEAGVAFLVLAGPEPDAQWERYVQAVTQIVETLDVRLAIGLNAIPMGVPHTRPINVISHGSRPELVAKSNNWIGTVRVPASLGHLLEYRLGEGGLDSVGFAVNVPHYLAQLDYPQAAAALVEHIAASGELQLPTGKLNDAAEVVRADIDKQVAASEQIASVVQALEQQYDELVAGRGPNLVADGATLPTADEIGAEFEQYLSQQIDPGESGGLN
jgi:predicted ATP-grasp superfamily ATP-dependent carboligase